MPAIKNKLLFVAAIGLGCVVTYLLVDRIVFLSRAQHTVGEVANVWGSDGTCGSRRRRHSCTNFKALVKFGTDQVDGAVEVSAGTRRGHGQPVRFARYRPGDRVPVVFNPRDPGEAYRDAFWDVWSAPIISLLIQIGVFFGSFSEGRRRA